MPSAGSKPLTLNNLLNADYSVPLPQGARERSVVLTCSVPPSPLVGEGARRADEGFLSRQVGHDGVEDGKTLFGDADIAVGEGFDEAVAL